MHRQFFLKADTENIKALILFYEIISLRTTLIMIVFDQLNSIHGNEHSNFNFYNFVYIFIFMEIK